MSQKPYIGGQAVIEGVMMRSPSGISVAVRRADGTVSLKELAIPRRFRSKIWKWPGFRGIGMLVESMSVGFEALKFSADEQMTEAEKAEPQSAGSRFAMMVSTLFAVGLFIALPQILATGAGKGLGVDFGLDDPRFHAVIGGFKLLIVFLYLLAISRVKEVQRVFQYHGAEHKTIHTWEANLDLTVENVRAQTTLHPRCGTTFLVVVVLVSIVIGTLVAPTLLFGLDGAAGWAALLVIRISLLPVIAAVSYELQRLSARYCTTGPLRVFLWPGFLFQKLSTREPTDDQIEVAIIAMQAAALRDRQAAEVVPDEVLVFSGFAGFNKALTGGMLSGGDSASS